MQQKRGSALLQDKQKILPACAARRKTPLLTFPTFREHFGSLPLPMVAFLLKFLKTQSTWVFVAYRLIFGVGLLAALNFG